MTGFRWLIDQFLQLPRWERLGNVVMTGMILLAILAVSIWPVKELTAEEKNELDRLESSLEVKQEKVREQEKQQKKYFTRIDPVAIDTFRLADLNKASYDDLLKCGLSKYLAHNIVKYIEKGGHIETVQDAQKLYGMTPEMLERLRSHTHLDSVRTKTSKPLAPKKMAMVDLNTADSVELVSVKGIGGKTAQRILNYRKQIGLFHSTEQLAEIRGIYPETLEEIKQQLTVQNFAPFIHINSVAEKELFKHPYFRSGHLAKVLVAYRNMHGKYKSAQDLKKCKLVTDEVLARILPYLIFD